MKKLNGKSDPIPPSLKYKAGFLLVGNVTKGDDTQLHVVAPWVQGAFSNDERKAYTLSKGTVDPTESVWRAATREVGEETGIYIDRIYNPHNAAHRQLSEAQRIEQFYDGVEIETILQTPIFDGIIPSNREGPARNILYVVKLKGIEHLAPHCKHFENNQAEPEDGLVSRCVSRCAADIAVAQKLPDFSALYRCLKKGEWTDKNGNKVRLFRKFEPASGWDKVRDADPDKLAKQFHKLDSETKDKIKDNLEKIRKQMERDRLLNDVTGLKIGNKHLPLQYYQEGADVLPYSEWLQRMVDYAKDNKLYRDIQFNRHCIERHIGSEYKQEPHSMAGLVLEVGRLLDGAQDVHEVRCPRERERFNQPATMYGAAVRHRGDLIDEVNRLVDTVSDSKGCRAA